MKEAIFSFSCKAGEMSLFTKWKWSELMEKSLLGLVKDSGEQWIICSAVSVVQCYFQWQWSWVQTQISGIYLLPICRVYRGQVSWHMFLFASSAQHVSSPLSRNTVRHALLISLTRLEHLSVQRLQSSEIFLTNFLLCWKTTCWSIVSKERSLDFITQN